MKLFKVGPIIEDIVGNGRPIDVVAKIHEVNEQEIRILMDYYYGVNEYQLKSYRIDIEHSRLKIKNYNSNNLTIIDKHSLILTL